MIEAETSQKSPEVIEAESSQKSPEVPRAKRTRKCLKICCCTTLLLLILLTVVCVTLYFTLFKPKKPQFTAHPGSLQNVDVQLSPFRLNVTISLAITINNPNYGSFKFENSTTYIDYQGTNIAEVPIDGGFAPARRKFNLSADAYIAADKLIENSHLLGDLVAGSLNFTSTSSVHGKAIVLKIFKVKVTALITCDISIFILTKSQEYKCNSKIKV